MEELDLKELFNVFWEKRIEIILITLIFMVIGIIYSYAFVKPEYKSSTTLLLATVNDTGNKNNDGATAITQTDLTLNSNLVSTYSELIKRNAVFGQVASNLNISNEEAEEIKKNISVNSAKDTEIIEIKVTNEDPNKAADVANEIAKVFSEKIVEIYNISNIYLLDRAEAPEKPSNVNHMKDIVVFAFIGLVISVTYVLVANMLDNTIKTEEDIEKVTGLVVLTAIPDYETELKNVRGGKR